MTRPPPISTLFPYTTLFRSGIRNPLRITLVQPQQPSRVFVGQRLQQYGANHSEECSSCSNAKGQRDRKSTRLNSSHSSTSYAVFCLKKKRRVPGMCW